jgi:hypothetical protein
MRSSSEMVNVGVAVATSAWFLASASEADALATVDLIRRARDARLALEQTQAATPEILAAWRKWYGEALDSVRRLKPGPTSAAVDAAVERAGSLGRRQVYN